MVRFLGGALPFDNLVGNKNQTLHLASEAIVVQLFLVRNAHVADGLKFAGNAAAAVHVGREQLGPNGHFARRALPSFRGPGTAAAGQTGNHRSNHELQPWIDTHDASLLPEPLTTRELATVKWRSLFS